MIAGISTKNSLMRIIIINPTITRITSSGKLSHASPKLLRIEYIVVIKSEKTSIDLNKIV